MEDQPGPSFCPLPWIHTAMCSQTAEYKLCCVTDYPLSEPTNPIDLERHTPEEALQTQRMQEIRSQMRQGKWPKSCQNCHKEEQQGIESMRQVALRQHSDKVEEILQSTSDEGKFLKSPKINDIELRLGNLCNLKCVMCSPGNSSSYDDFEYIFNGTPYEENSQSSYKNLDISTVIERLQSTFESVEYLTFRGGEPLINPDHKKILEYLVDKGYAQNISLTYSTNGTRWDESLVTLWKEFKSVVMWVSVDGVNEVNDFIRFPSKWQRIEKNLAHFHELSKKLLSFHCGLTLTLQAYNLFEIPKLSKWLKDYPFLIAFPFINILHSPEVLSPLTMPNEMRLEASKELQKSIEEIQLIPTNLSPKERKLLALKGLKSFSQTNIKKAESIIKYLKTQKAFDAQSFEDLRKITQRAINSRKIQDVEFLRELDILEGNI